MFSSTPDILKISSYLGHSNPSITCKPFVKPKVNPCFFVGEITKWKFRTSVTPSHGKYVFRYTLYFESATVIHGERGASVTKSECEKKRELAIAQLYAKEFVALIAEGIPEFLEMLNEVSPIHVSENGEAKLKEEPEIIACENLWMYLTELMPGELLKNVSKDANLKCIA